MNKFSNKVLKGLSAAFLASVLTTQAQAALVKYDLDPNHTNIMWVVDHQGFSKQNGKLSGVKGTLWLDDKDPTKSKVEATINLKEYHTGDKTWDEHLSGPDWFNTEKFTEATFVSNKVVMKGKDKAKVHGVLDFHGVKKPLVLDVKLNKVGINPMYKKKTVGFSATTELNRKDFGMVAAADPGMVGTKIKLDIQVEASPAEQK